jgi:hypothetical protein
MASRSGIARVGIHHKRQLADDESAPYRNESQLSPRRFREPGLQFTPDLYVRYFRDLRDTMASGAPMAQATAEVMARYATTPAADATTSRSI